MQSQTELTQSLKSEAKRLGFSLVGVCPAVSPEGFTRFEDWLERGFAGEMRYLENRREAYRHPESVLPEVRSVMVVGLNYFTVPARPTQTGQGRISRYAWGESDYHDLIRERLGELKNYALSLLRSDSLPNQGVAPRIRGVVDTAPLLEREFARMAGLGWFAKNTMLINPQQGSWFFLGALLFECSLDYDQPFDTSHCGSCTACLDICPTEAFPEPGVLDANRCISYLTIEHRSAIPAELRKGMGEWVFGCDLCQEVCPWNRKAPVNPEPAMQPEGSHNPLDLRELLEITDQQFQIRFGNTPLWRAKRRGLLRNAAIVLGNFPSADNIPSLLIGLSDAEPLVRGASAWALGQHRNREVGESLRHQLLSELDENVKKEIKIAIQTLDLSII
jgi:epoxyqueuosine reductase